MKNPGGSQSYNILGLGILASLLSVGMLWYAFSLKKRSNNFTLTFDYENELESDKEKSNENKSSAPGDNGTPIKSSRDVTKEGGESSAEVSTSESSKKTKQEIIHRQVEDADKRGKALFKAKQYLEAATCFTTALDLIESSDDSSLEKQAITLLNNRSAMYEKAGLAELALVDCDAVIEKDVGHSKARMRKLRLLENEKQYRDALVEVCSIQLR